MGSVQGSHHDLQRSVWWRGALVDWHVSPQERHVHCNLRHLRRVHTMLACAVKTPMRRIFTICIEPCRSWQVESSRSVNIRKGTDCLAWKDGRLREDTCYEDEPLRQAFMCHACDPSRGLREGHPMHVSSCEACCNPGAHVQLPYSQLIPAVHMTLDTRRKHTASLPDASLRPGFLLIKVICCC